MAESKLKLSFPDEFYTQEAVKKKFVRDGKSKEAVDVKTREWQKTDNKSRWKNVELYYGHQGIDKRQFPVLQQDSANTQQQQNLEPQFEIRF